MSYTLFKSAVVLCCLFVAAFGREDKDKDRD